MELRAGDSIRWNRNDTGLGLVNRDTAEVAVVRETASLSGSATGGCQSSANAIRNYVLPTMPGSRPCMRFRSAPSTT